MSENGWEKINVVFKLKSPLHIGYIPFKGSVISPTRYYVPGRNFWGAITKRVTEYLYKNPKAEDYKETGKQVIENFRFSYFYLYDGKTIYLPCYTNNGLKYGGVTKAEFEHRFIGSIVSTAIDSNGTAKDESLHEIEFINNKFKDENGDLKDVKIAGCIWVRKNAKIKDKKIIMNNKGIFIENFNIIRELILGGESKYGFGHVLLDSVNMVEFPIEVEYEQKSEKSNKDYKKCIIKVRINESKPLIAHLRYEKNIKFKGDIELLTGRGYFDPKNIERVSEKPGEVISRPKYHLSPGTILCSPTEDIVLNWNGALSFR